MEPFLRYAKNIIIFVEYVNNTQTNMAENKKEMERAELHRTIYGLSRMICEER